jgi:hypothetical protein
MFQNATVTLRGDESVVTGEDQEFGSAINAAMTKKREQNFRDIV